jgi:hypothetical protein
MHNRKTNQSFYRISAEEDVFNRYYHKPLPGESVKMYPTAEIYQRLKQKSPESMRNVSVQRPAQTLSVLNTSIPIMAIYIGWFHTLHSNSLNTIYTVGCVNPCLEFGI